MKEEGSRYPRPFPPSPRPPYPAQAVHSIPSPTLQLRSSSANTSPRAVTSHVSYPPYPAVAVSRQTTPPQSSPSTPHSPTPSLLLSLISQALQSTKTPLPHDEVLVEVQRQLTFHSTSPSPLTSPRRVGPPSPETRGMVHLDVSSLASLLLTLAAMAGGYRGVRGGGEGASHATAIPAMSVPSPRTHRASLPALLPSSVYPPHHPAPPLPYPPPSVPVPHLPLSIEVPPSYPPPSLASSLGHSGGRQGRGGGCGW